MVEILHKKDFKEMKWKNGGGITTEFFRLPTLAESPPILRISKAQVSSDGPFSAFPEVDRILLLTEGNGFHLKSSERELTVNNPYQAIHFRGEEVFDCTLIDGPCSDLNIMTDRRHANTTISVMEVSYVPPLLIKAECDLKLVYDIDNEMLIKLYKGDQYKMKDQKRSFIIVIDTSFI